jgi:uncharacterized protein (DUF1501 family)
MKDPMNYVESKAAAGASQIQFGKEVQARLPQAPVRKTPRIVVVDVVQVFSTHDNPKVRPSKWAKLLSKMARCCQKCTTPNLKGWNPFGSYIAYSFIAY